MTKEYTITIEGLPEGWRPVKAEFTGADLRESIGVHYAIAKITLEKTKPRRIVLEETGEETVYPTSGYMYGYINNDGFTRYKTLREVKDDILAKELEALAMEHAKDWNKGR